MISIRLESPDLLAAKSRGSSAIGHPSQAKSSSQDGAWTSRCARMVPLRVPATCTTSTGRASATGRGQRCVRRPSADLFAAWRVSVFLPRCASIFIFITTSSLKFADCSRLRHRGAHEAAETCAGTQAAGQARALDQGPGQRVGHQICQRAPATASSP